MTVLPRSVRVHWVYGPCRADGSALQAQLRLPQRISRTTTDPGSSPSISAKVSARALRVAAKGGPCAGLLMASSPGGGAAWMSIDPDLTAVTLKEHRFGGDPMTTNCADTAFSTSRDRFEQVCSFLGDQEAASLTHGELEQQLSVDLRELVRLLYQDHLDLRAVREQRRDDVVDAEGSRRARVEAGQVRPLQTIFGAVYVLTPLARTPTDIIGRDDDTLRRAAPKASNKWLTASVVEGAATVICSIFEEAQRRDPTHQRTWVALVDGAKHQIDRIQAEATARHVQVTIVCDFIHVLEYLWSAAWSFFTESDPDAEKWVAEKALAVLNGQASTVAAAIRRKATTLGLDPRTRRGADRCADYLLAKRDYLNYPQALQAGWPIATGIIEGACRHLVKDRLDLTGARWGLQGAEAILKLRALRSNGDFEQYWTFHLNQELHQVHETRYADMTIPTAA